jgi:hypothetical protein
MLIKIFELGAALIGIIATIFGIIITILKGPAEIISTSRQWGTWFTRYIPALEMRRNRKIIEGLQVGVLKSAFESQLGGPTYTNKRGEYREHIYTNKFYYVTAITDNESMVKCFTVTSRNKSFHPKFQSPYYPRSVPSFEIILGTTTFSQIPNPTFLTGYRGARIVAYYELHYLGNPGNYKEFAFGFNHAGFHPQGLDFTMFNGINQSSDGNIYSSVGKEKIEEFRAKTVMNTYAVSAPSVQIRPFIDLFGRSTNLGVDYDQVR